MSLTSLIDDRHGPVREWFEAHLPELKPMRQGWKRAGPVTIPPLLRGGALGQVGAALDYRIRYWFELFPPEGTVAGLGAIALHGPTRAGTAFETVAAELTALLAAHDPRGRLLDEGTERRLARLCYILALYEVHFRSHAPTALLDLPAVPSADQLAALAPPGAVDDIVALTSGFADTRGSLPPPAEVVTNPTFALSSALGGADADLIVDGCLLDIKATTQPMGREAAYQLLGYLLADLPDRYRIHTVGFYLARTPGLVAWPVTDLLGEVAARPVGLAELRADFATLVASLP